MTGVLNAAVWNGPRVQLTGRTLSSSNAWPTTGSVSVGLTRLGALTTAEKSGAIMTHVMRLPSWAGNPFAAAVTIGGPYEARLTVSAGSSPNSGDTVNSWLALSSDRSWTITQSDPGSQTGTWLVEIRIASGSVLASASFPFTAASLPP